MWKRAKWIQDEYIEGHMDTAGVEGKGWGERHKDVEEGKTNAKSHRNYERNIEVTDCN